MSNPTVLFRSLVVYGLCVPAAIFIGYLLANPEYLLMYRTETALAGVLVFIVMSPLFLKFYQVWLLAVWNASAVLFFLPGNPQVWMALAAIGIVITVLQYILSRENRIISVPFVTWPLVVLSVVILLTARLTGGIGFRAFGSEVYGGKRYFMMLLAIVGYFVIVSRRIPLEKANRYVILFFLGSTTMVIGSTAGLLPPGFSFLYSIFPVENLGYLSNIASASVMSRSWGLSLLSLGVFCAMLSRYGASGILTLQRPHRFIIFFCFVFIGLLGGFRSILIIYMLTFGVLLYLEGLLRTRLLPVILLTIILGGALITAFATHLPLSVQRSLAFLPVKIDPIAQMDAAASSEWRLQMWRNVLPEIPQHLLLGKGFLFSGMDDFMFAFKGGIEGSKGSELVGDYHNGPLSIILPFGVPGVLAFIWLFIAGWKVMYRNYKYSPPEYKTINTFLFAYYTARVMFFFTIFGSSYSDLAMFTGLIGLSVSLNNGVLSKTAPEPVRQQTQFQGSAFAGRVRAQVGF